MFPSIVENKQSCNQKLFFCRESAMFRIDTNTTRSAFCATSFPRMLPQPHPPSLTPPNSNLT